jgi:hypothetical protein
MMSCDASTPNSPPRMVGEARPRCPGRSHYRRSSTFRLQVKAPADLCPMAAALTRRPRRPPAQVQAPPISGGDRPQGVTLTQCLRRHTHWMLICAPVRIIRG